MDVGAIQSCSEIDEGAVDEAVQSLVNLRALLGRAGEVAQPEQGAANVLLVLARLAHGDVGWLEGEVYACFSGGEADTTLDLFCDQGFGLRERLLQVRFEVPVDEFQRAVLLQPRLVRPLHPHQGRARLRLTMSAEAESAPPPAVEIEEEAMPHARTTAPPTHIEPTNEHTRPTVPAMAAVRPETHPTARPQPEND